MPVNLGGSPAGTGRQALGAKRPAHPMRRIGDKTVTGFRVLVARTQSGSGQTKQRDEDPAGGRRTVSTGELIAELPKNQREVVRLRRTEYNGMDLVDARVWRCQ